MATTDNTGERLDEGLRLVLPGRSLGAGAGWEWIAAGWKLFTPAVLMWIISLVVVVVVAIASNLIPILGGLLFQSLQAVIAAGFMAACRSIERGGDFEIEHLMAGFTKRFGSLFIVGLIMVAGWIAIFLVFMVFVGFGLLGALMSGDTNAVAAAIYGSIGLMLVGVLVATALMVPLLMAYWFAPVLVLMHDMAPVAAMKASFGACLRNFMPFLVYGLVMVIFAILAAIPFGLGFLVWWPVALASTYVAYRRIFTDDVAAVAPAAGAVMVS